MHPSWGSYPDTCLDFSESGLTIDLRAELTPSERDALAAAGLGRPFAVVTACNPFGRPLDETGNHRLTSVLGAIVREGWPGARACTGRNPEGTHQEPGWAIPSSREDARRLAARFFQLGMFWFDGERFFIEPAVIPGPVLALPVTGPSV